MRSLCSRGPASFSCRTCAGVVLVQGYLAHEKAPPHRALHLAYAYGPTYGGPGERGAFLRREVPLERETTHLARICAVQRYFDHKKLPPPQGPPQGPSRPGYGICPNFLLLGQSLESRDFSSLEPCFSKSHLCFSSLQNFSETPP